MKEEKWDRESNILTEEEIKAEHERLLAERMAVIQRQHEINLERERREYIEPAHVTAREISLLFPFQAEILRREGELDNGQDIEYYDSHPDEIFSSWWANKVFTICHNCGAIGYKNGRIRKTCKCYCCRSRNMQVVRAADISRILRNHRDVGVLMEDVYNARQEENRIRRAQRSTRRRNSQRTS